MKRLVDIIGSFLGLIVLSPFMAIIAIAIKLESKGEALFKQVRVGKNNRDFKLYKFRTMYVRSEYSGQLTVGMRDPRITRIGYILRKYKLDEIPQLFNVLIGDMSLVGPRPEVRTYVNLYTAEQLRVLSVKPGITDYASLEYIRENEILGASINPHETYIHEIMPEKLRMNLEYIDSQSLMRDLGLIIKTVVKLIK